MGLNLCYLTDKDFAGSSVKSQGGFEASTSYPPA